jgi:hypothetical protein
VRRVHDDIVEGGEAEASRKTCAQNAREAAAAATWGGGGETRGGAQATNEEREGNSTRSTRQVRLAAKLTA